MFGPVKEAPRGMRFSSVEEVIGTVQNWLKTGGGGEFLTEWKNLGGAGAGSLGSRGVAFKSTIGFGSAYLQ
jgi:hypothetical protein